VHPSERLQRSPVERLHADREPGHAGVAEGPELRPLERARVRLERDLRVGIERQPGAHRIEQARDGRSRKQARRATTDEHRVHPASPDQRQRRLQVGHQRIDIRLERRLATRFMRVEVAVRAFADAPGQVDVQRQRRQARQPPSRRATATGFDRLIGQA
jgi:hypothetical protein